MAFQADDLRLYAEAYARWDDPGTGTRPTAIHRYMRRF